MPLIEIMAGACEVKSHSRLPACSLSNSRALDAADIGKDDIMSTNRIQGASKKAQGSIKEGVGKITGNTKLRAEGVIEKAVGSAQNAVGKAQDKIGAALTRS